MRNNTPLANKETTSKRSSATFKDEESVSNSSDKKSRKGLAEDVRYDTKEEISLNRLINPIATGNLGYSLLMKEIRLHKFSFWGNHNG